eukprot:CAMPEP_0205822608 /NCGR_PEP_ID=MMETSP0206-20130828/13260_1 /ASSEMBLY_ACC=CAM_ASM_000279 /TAXON_ID=36767 /ORGANISM="Euplotes focardii, Strain TN1" /LENGTH=105 /DNA_ID=CAMNT_0053119027 /DNA_START=249 /DNA_END=566 /DNA_ORIENTATION=-
MPEPAIRWAKQDLSAAGLGYGNLHLKHFDYLSSSRALDKIHPMFPSHQSQKTLIPFDFDLAEANIKAVRADADDDYGFGATKIYQGYLVRPPFPLSYKGQREYGR